MDRPLVEYSPLPPPLPRRLAVTAPPVGGRKGRFGPASFVSASARRTARPRRGEKSRRRVPFPDRTRRPLRPSPRKRRPTAQRRCADQRLGAGAREALTARRGLLRLLQVAA